MQTSPYTNSGSSMNYTQSHPSSHHQPSSLPQSHQLQQQALMHMSPQQQQQPQQHTSSITNFPITSHANTIIPQPLSSLSSTSTATMPLGYNNPQSYSQQQLQSQLASLYGCNNALGRGGNGGGGVSSGGLVSNIPTPSQPLDYHTTVMSDISGNNQPNKQTYENCYSAVEQYRVDKQLNSDYDEACNMTLTDDEEYLHMLYARLPTDLSRDSHKYRAINLIHSTYINKYQDLIERQPCLEHYLFMLCCLLVRVTRDEKLLLSLKNENVTATSHVNKFLFSKTGVFRLPRTVKQAIDNKDKKKNHKRQHEDTPLATTKTVVAGALSRGSGGSANDSKRMKTHPIYELPYINDNVMSLGKFLGDCTPLDFVPLHCTVRLSSVTHYVVGKNEGESGVGSSATVQNSSSGSLTSQQFSGPGVAIDNRYRIFAVVSTVHINDFTYQNIDPKYCPTFIKYVHDILPGRHLDRFRINTLKKPICKNLITLDSAVVGPEMLPMVLCDRVSLFATRANKLCDVSSTSLSTQSFSAQTFVININEYEKIINIPHEYNLRHCRRLEREYHIQYEDEEEEQQQQQQQPTNYVASAATTDTPLTNGNKTATNNDGDNADSIGVNKDDDADEDDEDEEDEDETVAE